MPSMGGDTRKISILVQYDTVRISLINVDARIGSPAFETSIVGSQTFSPSRPTHRVADVQVGHDERKA